jgi:hypothetical protein
MDLYAYIAIAAALVLVGLVAARLGKGRAASLAVPEAGDPPAALGPELVAVIAAAVAAASGSAPGSFRIASIVPSESSGGFNTPVWGHADRLCRPANHR